MGELTKQVGQIVSDIAGAAAKEIGEMIKDELRPYRATQQARLAEKTAQRLQARNIQPHPVHPKILLSVFENAGLEDDEEMHDRWATLLANAATPGFEFPISIVFVEILKQLSPQEAVFLELVVTEFEQAKTQPKKYPSDKPLMIPEEHDLGVYDDLLKIYARAGFVVLPEAKTAQGYRAPEYQTAQDGARLTFNIVLANVERLGVLKRATHVEQYGPRETRFGIELDVQNYERHYLTSLGYRLVVACRASERAQSSSS